MRAENDDNDQNLLRFTPEIWWCHYDEGHTVQKSNEVNKPHECALKMNTDRQTKDQERKTFLS